MNNPNTYRNAYNSLSYTNAQKKHIAEKAAAAALKIRQKPSGNPHLISKLAATAACFLCVLTLSAEAAGISTPISQILAPIFGGSPAQTEVIDKIGRPIDARDTDNGVTIQADAIIGDQYNACIVFTIRRDDGTPLLPENAMAEQLLLGGFCDVSLAENQGTHGIAGFEDAVPGDSEIHYVNVISSDTPLNAGTAKVDFRNISYIDGKSTVPVVKGNWKFQFDVDYEDSSVSFGRGSRFSQYGLNFTITEASVSPVGIRIAYEVDTQIQWSDAPSGRLPEKDRFQTERCLEDVEILLVKKDGTVIDMTNSGGTVSSENGRTSCIKSRVFEEILPLEEVASVRVGGIDFPIDGAI